MVAASSVPASASHSSLHEHTERQPPDPPHPLDERSVVNRRSGSPSAVGIQSRACDTYSTETNSLDSNRSPHSQPSRLPRGTHRQFGRGPNPSQSRERPTRPSTPTTRPNTPLRPPSITTNLPSPTQESDKVSHVVQFPASSCTHESRGPPHMHENCRRQPAILALGIENPSTDSLPPTIHSPDTSAVDVRLERHHEPGSPTYSNHPTADYFIPEGRFVRLIQSEQIPRYAKNTTMQVDHIVLSLHSYTSLQTPCGDTLLCETFNNRLSLVRCNLSHIVRFKSSL